MLLGLIWNHPLRPGMILDFQELSGGFQELPGMIRDASRTNLELSSTSENDPG